MTTHTLNPETDTDDLLSAEEETAVAPEATVAEATQADEVRRLSLLKTLKRPKRKWRRLLNPQQTIVSPCPPF